MQLPQEILEAVAQVNLTRDQTVRALGGFVIDHQHVQLEKSAGLPALRPGIGDVHDDLGERHDRHLDLGLRLFAMRVFAAFLTMGIVSGLNRILDGFIPAEPHHFQKPRRADGKRHPTDASKKAEQDDSKDSKRLFHSSTLNRILRGAPYARTNTSPNKLYCNRNLFIFRFSQV